MQTRRCDQGCAYFKWTAHGTNYRAYCMKSSKSIKDMGACPLKWAVSHVEKTETMTVQ